MKVNKIDIILLFVLFTLLFFFLAEMGTINSGLHFTDDHEIITLNKSLQSASINTVSKNRIITDFNYRFRPLYFYHRVIQTKLFGENFTIWSIYTALLGCITMSFFYLGIRLIGFSYSEAIIFILIILTGHQTAIWWRLGHNETIGMPLLAIGFYFMTRSIVYKDSKINNYLFVFFLVIASLCKESFIIIIPAFVFFKVWFDYKQEKWPIKKIIKKNKILLVPLLVMIMELLFIILVVGTNKIGYAGLTSVSLTINGIINILKYNLRYFIFLEIIILGTTLILLNCRKKYVNYLKSLILPFFFCLLIVIPNVLLYATSGMDERYLLPSTIGISFLLVSQISVIKGINERMSKINYGILLVFISFFAYKASVAANQFTIEGINTNKFINSIFKKNTGNENIMLIVDPAYSFEWTFSLITILRNINNNIKIYGQAIESRRYDKFQTGLSKQWYSIMGKNNKLDGLPDIILFFDYELVDIVKKRAIYPLNEEYQFEKYGSFAIYKKNESI